MSARLEGRIALITGASRGIGAAVAKAYAAEGAQLVLLARTVGGLEEVDDAIRAAGGLRPLLVPQDLRDFPALDRLGRALHERYGRLDVLIGNAGTLGRLSPIGHVPPKDWQEVIDVNLSANWRLVRSLDPLLRLSDAGRAIFVTSGVATTPFAFWGPYAASKAGLEMLVKVYAAEIAKTKLRVNLLDPGQVRTAMRAKAFPGENPASLPTPETLASLFVELALPSCRINGQVVRAC